MAKREIWRDFQDEVESMLHEDLPNEDPHCDRANSNLIELEPEPIVIDSMDWDTIEVEIERDLPFDQPLENVSDDDIMNDWSWTESSDSWPMDQCAWYEAYHYRHKHWGIHFDEGCVVRTANKFWKHKQFKTHADALKGAVLFLYLHEFFHYIMENSCTVIEVVARDPNLYIRYSANVYSKTFRSTGALEEALAERYLYGRGQGVAHLDSVYLQKTLQRGPPGYRDFDQYLGGNFWKGRRSLMSQALYTNPSPKLKPVEQVMELLEPRSYTQGHKVPLWLHPAPSRMFRIYSIR
ncbi:MAG: hypothetical protein M1587_08585 [Thaumarchaeota archaeon]|nr:hypothetical protein [Nitrososphaerota archaeon]MCL5068234.1 hypothetical protein [Nitrososphaerota archaeon]